MKLKTCIIGEELLGGADSKELPKRGHLESAALPYPFERIGWAGVAGLCSVPVCLYEISPDFSLSLSASPFILNVHHHDMKRRTECRNSPRST